MDAGGAGGLRGNCRGLRCPRADGSGAGRPKARSALRRRARRRVLRHACQLRRRLPARHPRPLASVPPPRAPDHARATHAMRPQMMGAHPTIAGFGYHEITDDPAATGFQRPGARPYTLTPRAFAAHLDQMAASEARPMRLTDIDFTRPRRFLVLTFDDGGKHAMYAGDALSRRGSTGNFFLISCLIGRPPFPHRSAALHLPR